MPGIPGFVIFTQHDQVTLLKAGTFGGDCLTPALNLGKYPAEWGSGVGGLLVTERTESHPVLPVDWPRTFIIK